MRKVSLAIAAVAALSITAQAHAAIVTTDYTFTTGDAGSGTFSVDIDFAANSFVLSAFDYTLGSTTFTTATGIGPSKTTSSLREERRSQWLTATRFQSFAVCQSPFSPAPATKPPIPSTSTGSSIA